MIWNVVLFSHWQTVNGHNEMSAAVDFPASWTDITQQADAAILARTGAHCCLVQGLVNDATLAAIQAAQSVAVNGHKYLILARWEEVAPGATPSYDDRKSAITAGQGTALVNYMNAEFGINILKIPNVQNAVGKTRIVVLNAVINDLQKL